MTPVVLGDFTKLAEKYRQTRPSYPATMIDWLLASAGLKPGQVVAEFGAGTGILTQLLLERGLKITAIEPNAAMRAQSRVPGAKWLEGTFEDSNLASQSQDWAVAGQAFHWADPVRSLPEIHRILKPGGVFAVLWNHRANDEHELLRWAEHLIRLHIPEFEEHFRYNPWRQILESTGHFHDTEYFQVRHDVEMTRQRFVDLWRSQNRLNAIAGPERFARFISDLENEVAIRSEATIYVPYECVAWSAKRS